MGRHNRPFKSDLDASDRDRDGRGRSAAKRQAKLIEMLANRLADMKDSQLGQIPQSEELAEELRLARSTKGRGSRKRQIKHLAGYLRSHDDELEQVQAALDGLDQRRNEDAAAFRQLEDLRDRLCAAATFEVALTEASVAYPALDAGKIRKLALRVHEQDDRSAARQVFRRLRKAWEERSAAEATTE